MKTTNNYKLLGTAYYELDEEEYIIRTTSVVTDENDDIIEMVELWEEDFEDLDMFVDAYVEANDMLAKKYDIPIHLMDESKPLEECECGGEDCCGYLFYIYQDENKKPDIGDIEWYELDRRMN